MGLGTLLIFFGVALLSARIARPFAHVLGWPAQKIGGIAGALARDNSQRNPQRTASTASALMIGLALITLVAVLAAGITSSFRGAVNDLWTSGYAVTAQDNFTPIPIAAGNAAARTPGVEAIANVRAGDAQVFKKTIGATGINPQAVGIFNLDWVAGSDAVFAHLGAHGAIVDKDYAKHHRLQLRSPIRLETPGGKFLSLRVAAIFNPPKGGSPLGTVTVSSKAFDSVYPNPQNVFTFVDTPGGVTPSNTA
jgi:putative ABC transport system permease protein